MANHDREHRPPQAVVKGAGPAGLACAAALTQVGFAVHVVEKREQRPLGKGRRNMVAMRAEALRRLDELGALEFVRETEILTPMVKGKTWSEIDGSVFDFPLIRYPPAQLSSNGTSQDIPEYQIPGKINEQVPNNFICLGDLEDALAHTAVKNGATITYNATVCLRYESGSNQYSAILTETKTHVIKDLGIPTLIVCASGKNDLSIEQDLRFTRERCTVLTDAKQIEPSKAKRPFELTFQSTIEPALESQIFSIFGVKSEAVPLGVLDHVIRKYPLSKYNDIPKPSHDGIANGTTQTNDTVSSTNGTADSPDCQPVVEIQMNHSSAAHLILQHPRTTPPLSTQPKALESYILSRINTRLGTSFPSIESLRNSSHLLWGAPLTPITVETSTAPAYVFGTNVVLVGDCAMSCSPLAGLGADIGMTVDSACVGRLGSALLEAMRDNDEQTKMDALTKFNAERAESSVIWSQGSRMFYLTVGEVDKILNARL